MNHPGRPGRASQCRQVQYVQGKTTPTHETTAPTRPPAGSSSDDTDVLQPADRPALTAIMHSLSVPVRNIELMLKWGHAGGLGVNALVGHVVV